MNGFKDKQQKNYGEREEQCQKDNKEYCKKQEHKGEEAARSRGELLGEGNRDMADFGCQYTFDYK